MKSIAANLSWSSAPSHSQVVEQPVKGNQKKLAEHEGNWSLFFWGGFKGWNSANYI